MRMWVMVLLPNLQTPKLEAQRQGCYRYLCVLSGSPEKPDNPKREQCCRTLGPRATTQSSHSTQGHRGHLLQSGPGLWAGPWR